MSDSERIEWSRAINLLGVDLLLADRCTRMWKVFHETYTVCTLLDISGGETEWSYKGRMYAAKAGELMLMEPGEVHSMAHTIPPCDFRVLLIDPRIVAQAALELGMTAGEPHWRSGHAIDPGLFPGLARLHASLGNRATALEQESRFVTCLRALLERHTEFQAKQINRPARSLIRRARDFIHVHHASRIKLGELAAIAGVSRFHLVRAFTKEFGLPPHAYQIRVQVGRARTLLAAGVAPAVAAAEAGFADQSHLTRHFKYVYGVTPGQYRLAR